MMRILYGLLGVIVLFGGGAIALCHLTKVTELRSVNIDGEASEDWSARYSFATDRPIFHQPLENVAAQIMARRGVVKVDIDYQLPHLLTVRTNDFRPACLATDRLTRLVRGITDDGRVIPLPEDFIDWQQPILSNVTTGKLYGYCEDIRARILVPQLRALRTIDSALFARITETDFTNAEYLLVRLANFPVPARVTEGNFVEQVQAFERFIREFEPNESNVNVFDVRFSNMIVAVMRDTLADSTSAVSDSVGMNPIVNAVVKLPNQKVRKPEARDTRKRKRGVA